MKGYKMRIVIDGRKAFEIVNDILRNCDNLSDDNRSFLKDLSKNLYQELMKSPSEKKIKAAEKATVIRQERAKEKIRNAVNLLHLENAKVNINSVAKKANVSYNTAKKYSYLIYQID